MGSIGLTLVCFAVKEEAGPFARMVAQRPAIRTLVTGMGRANAERAVRAALASQRVELLVTSGFAGGLAPELEPGTVLFEADQVPALRPGLLTAGARPGRFHCAQRVVGRAAEKGTLRQRTGADAVEMESGFIYGCCAQAGVPAATVRVILDPATQDLPLDFNALIEENQKLVPARIALAVLTAPTKIPALINLRKKARQAAERLAGVLAQALRELQERSGPGNSD